MLSYTVTGSAENFALLIAALEDRREGLVGEEGTDRELYIAWLKGVHREPALKYARQQAAGAITVDDIVEVT